VFRLSNNDDSAFPSYLVTVKRLSKFLLKEAVERAEKPVGESTQRSAEQRVPVPYERPIVECHL